MGLEETQKVLNAGSSIWSISEPDNFVELPQVLSDLKYNGVLLHIHGPGQRGSLTTMIDHGVV